MQISIRTRVLRTPMDLRPHDSGIARKTAQVSILAMTAKPGKNLGMILLESQKTAQKPLCVLKAHQQFQTNRVHEKSMAKLKYQDRTIATREDENVLDA